MQNFDFNDEFIKLILSCITTPHFLILLNGSPFDYFKVGRGIRQGDPCPHPYLLFIHICCLGFFPILSGIRVLRQSPKITHLMYVDDLVIYCRTFIEKVVEATKCLQTYCRWTRQDINWTKSSIHFSRNVSSQLRGEITRAMGIQECKHKGKYLGHPFCQLKNKTKAYSDILEKLKNELTRWRKISLSIAGRLVLTKAVIQSISSFTMHVMLLPKSILGKIERRSRDFLWGHSEQKKHHLYLKAWDTICVPKAGGGLGLRRWKIWIRFSSLNYPGTCLPYGKKTWVKLIKAKYLWGIQMLDAQRSTTTVSWIWGSLLQTIKILRQGVCYQLCVSSSLRIKEDPWLPTRIDFRIPLDLVLPSHIFLDFRIPLDLILDKYPTFSLILSRILYLILQFMTWSKIT